MEKIFEINTITALFYGFIFAVVNGILSGYFLKKNLNSNNKRFFTVFILTFLYRLFFLVFSVWLLRRENAKIILLYALILIAGEIFFELYYITGYGTKRNT